jgi:DnaJ domain
MDEGLTEAYELLTAGPDASDEEIRDRYRELAHQAHPDQGGTDAEMARLADAYALVRSSRGSGNDGLVLFRRADIVPHAPIDPVVREELQDDSQRAFEAALRHRTSRLKQARRQGIMVAICSAALGAVVALMKTFRLDIIEDSEGAQYVWLSSPVRLILVVLFFVLGAFFAFLAWRASMRATWIETALEDFDDALSDKNSFLRLMRFLSQEAQLPERWTRDELIVAITRWSNGGPNDYPALVRQFARGLLFPKAAHDEIPLEQLAQIAGAADTANLVISKGRERGLIDEQPSSDRTVYAYQLTL